jgi:hypothetical protein
MNWGTHERQSFRGEKERITALARQYAHGKDVLDQLTVNGV